MIYGLSAMPGEELAYTGVAGRLPGAAQFAVGVLINTIALEGEEVIFQNDGTATGWFLSLEQSAVDPRVVLLTLTFGVVGPLTDTITVPIGACANEWLFVAFTVDSQNALVVYVNGEVAYTAALNAAVIPSVGTPNLETETNIGATLVSWAFYTEGSIGNEEMAFLNAQLKKNAGTIDWASLGGVVVLQHIYSATQSMRPVTSNVWADTGSTPNAPLTLEEGTPVARVLPGDFSQAVIGALVDPTGPTGPVL
jgi:hypothetical protein